MNPDINHFEVLTPSGYVVLDLGAASTFLERKYSNLLKPPTPGVYKVGEQNPSILFTEAYFIKSVKDKNRNKQLASIEELINGDYVHDASGRIVLDHHIVANREYALSNLPTVPTTGFSISTNIVKFHIASKNEFTKESTNYISSIGKMLKDEYVNTDLIHEIIDEAAFDSFFRVLDTFVGRDINHVYFYKPSGLCTLIVEKTIDWRAYQWHLSNNGN